MISTAYLRVYLPATGVGAIQPASIDVGEQTIADDGFFISTESTRDDAIFTLYQNEQYACPRNTRIRMIEGVLAFTKMYPILGVTSDTEKADLVAELSELRNASSLSRSYILSSAWHVPLRWFAVFSPSEREIYETQRGSSIRYRTPIGEAVERVRWSSKVLSESGLPEPVIEQVDDLERWLIEFQPDAIVELDYDRVAQIFSEADLVLDESVDNVLRSLQALEAGDGDTAQRYYQEVASRWFPAQSFTFSN